MRQEKPTRSPIIESVTPDDSEGLASLSAPEQGSKGNVSQAPPGIKTETVQPKPVKIEFVTDYFEKLVNINLGNLSSYYITVKSHADKSFFASLYVGLVGFLLIGAGIFLTISNSANAPTVATLSGLSGVVTELISAVFFYLYSQTVRQMKGYHDSLLRVQNILLSFKLVESTKDEKDKTKMIEKMIEYLVVDLSSSCAASVSKQRDRASEATAKSEPV